MSAAASLQKDSAAVVAIAKQNIESIDAKFAVLLTKSRKRLQIKKIDVEEVQEFLIYKYSSPDSRDGSGTVTTVVESAKSLKEIFCVLSKYKFWDYLNYYLLQTIIKNFASDDDELNGMMEQYQKDLTGHILSQKIETYLDAVSDGDSTANEISTTPTPELFKMLTTKCDANVSEHTLSYVTDLRQSLSNQFALPPTALILHKISKGCISITWRIPTNLDKYVTKTAQETASTFTTERIMKVMLEEKSIYCESHLQSVEDQLTSEKKLLEDLKEKKMEVEKWLQLKEEDLESLRKVNQKNSEELQNKEAGLATLQEHLHTLQSKLTSERKLQQELREELQHELTKLEKKLQVELTSQYTREVEVMRHRVQIPNENKFYVTI